MRNVVLFWRQSDFIDRTIVTAETPRHDVMTLHVAIQSPRPRALHELVIDRVVVQNVLARLTAWLILSDR